MGIWTLWDILSESRLHFGPGLVSRRALSSDSSSLGPPLRPGLPKDGSRRAAVIHLRVAVKELGLDCQNMGI